MVYNVTTCKVNAIKQNSLVFFSYKIPAYQDLCIHVDDDDNYVDIMI